VSKQTTCVTGYYYDNYKSTCLPDGSKNPQYCKDNHYKGDGNKCYQIMSTAEPEFKCNADSFQFDDWTKSCRKLSVVSANWVCGEGESVNTVRGVCMSYKKAEPKKFICKDSIRIEDSCRENKSLPKNFLRLNETVDIQECSAGLELLGDICFSELPLSSSCDLGDTQFDHSKCCPKENIVVQGVCMKLGPRVCPDNFYYSKAFLQKCLSISFD